MAHNRYYIVNADDPNMQDIKNIIVGGQQDKQRCSLDLTLIVVKLYENDHQEHEVLAQYTEYSHEQILPIMQSEAWQPQVI